MIIIASDPINLISDSGSQKADKRVGTHGGTSGVFPPTRAVPSGPFPFGTTPGRLYSIFERTFGLKPSRPRAHMPFRSGLMTDHPH